MSSAEENAKKPVIAPSESYFSLMAKAGGGSDFPGKLLDLFERMPVTEVRRQCLKTLVNTDPRYEIGEWYADQLENIISQLNEQEKTYDNPIWLDLLGWYVLQAGNAKEKNGVRTIVRAIKFTLALAKTENFNVSGWRYTTKIIYGRLAKDSWYWYGNEGPEIFEEVVVILMPFFTSTINELVDNALRFTKPDKVETIDWPIVERIGKSIERLRVYDHDLYQALGQLLGQYNKGKISAGSDSKGTLVATAATAEHKVFLTELLALMKRVREEQQE